MLELNYHFLILLLLLLYCIVQIYDFKEIDKIHIKFCKHILGVGQQTPKLTVFGELGRYPMSVICKERALKYWIMLMKNDDIPMYRMCMEQCNNNYDNCWAKNINCYLW